jgi:uncharacterized protein (TIGR00251 family)
MIDCIFPVQMKLNVKVVPGASRSSIDGWLGDALKIRVAAPAERGRANDAVRDILARTLGIPRSSVRIISGQSSPRKIVEIDEMDDTLLRSLIGDIA